MSANLPEPIYVDDDAGFSRLVRTLARQRAIAIDCEANSMFAYREQLCLLQISTRSHDYLVDPLADIDLPALGPVLADPCITKILHGAEFDVLLLKRTHPFEIAGVFDTRVAAASLGVAAAGLAAVLDSWLGVTIDKKFQRSNWGARPLSAGQMDYARRDTHFLLDLADALREDLRRAGSPHVEEVAAECRRLETVEAEPRRPNPDEWARLKGAGRLDPRARRALEQIHKAREAIARRRDQPPFKVLGNAHLMHIAQERPRSMSELLEIDTLPRSLVERHGKAFVEAVRVANELGPIDRMPPSGDPPAEDQLQPSERRVYEALRQWRKRTSERRGAEAALILSRAAMLAVAELHPTPRTAADLFQALEGWRIDHYGDGILDAIEDAVPRRRRRSN